MRKSVRSVRVRKPHASLLRMKRPNAKGKNSKSKSIGMTLGLQSSASNRNLLRMQGDRLSGMLEQLRSLSLCSTWQILWVRLKKSRIVLMLKSLKST